MWGQGGMLRLVNLKIINGNEMKKLLFFASIILTTGFAMGQTVSDTDFGSFAKQQNTLMVAAYEKQDVSQYNALLTAFLKRYEGLSKEEQKQYAYYYMNAYYNLSCTYSLLKNKQMAISSLDKAIRAGYANYAHILQDSDLNYIRNDKAFKAIILPLRETGDY